MIMGVIMFINLGAEFGTHLESSEIAMELINTTEFGRA